jgi:phage baseplate assembly protein W
VPELSEKRRVLGTDLRVSDDGTGADLVLSRTGDLTVVSHEYNLGQAILTRLRTRTGELRELGHKSLGSRLYEFLGEPNNLSTRERIRNCVREALLEEPRVKEISRIEVLADKKERDRVEVLISVVAIGTETPLNIVLPFFLEVA